jgi:hypothetical protein
MASQFKSRRRFACAPALFILTFIVVGLLPGQVPPVPGTTLSEYSPITGGERLRWLAVSTVGPASLGVGVLSAGWSTAFNNPPEYGTHWDGFGKRYGIRLSGVGTGNAIEAGLGAVLGEDPRYFRAEQDETFGGRLKHITKLTFLAPRQDGRLGPAYARHAGNVGNNVLSNTWRVGSQTSVDDTAIRIVLGVGGRMAGNAFAEFWPDVRRRVFRRGGD